ncbi:MAG TPA: hypothetical protein VJT72_16680 [Pseudonocardiaceae bacterium]|nr:hypothetical protein [Pseudonocardiaceae bacterium]
MALDHEVDWRLELEMALAARVEVERDSRRPEVPEPPLPRHFVVSCSRGCSSR